MKTQGSGLSPKRLKNVDAYLQRIVDEEKVAGAGGLIIRHGEEAYHSSYGMRDREKKAPLMNDSIYRIYSLTKIYTIGAAMTLYEKGLFRLHQSIGDFLPEYKNPNVVVRDARGTVSIVPAKGPITFEHLFTMTSGIPSPGEGSYSSRAMGEIFKKADKDAAKGKNWNLARIAAEAAKVPLCFHPGECWMYGFSHDLLGRLIEVISGKPFGAYLSETFFEPLGMKDTAFFVPPEKQDRVVKPYRAGNEGLQPIEQVKDLCQDPASPQPPSMELGGRGLCSTMQDCARYAQMLLHEGMAGSKRILSRKTIELIRRSHCVPKEMTSFQGFDQIIGYGYGLGVRTMLDTAKAGLNGSVGEWAWDGAMGTWYCIDPVEDLTALFFVQIFSSYNSDLYRGFSQTVYGAIDD